MEAWSTHHLFKEASEKHDDLKATALAQYALELREKGLPVIFTLGHLAKITGVEYRMLNHTILRKREHANYRMFTVKKRSGGRRILHAVSTNLYRIQQFINEKILQACKPHPCSFAFHPSGGIRACAASHCGARWLFQFDLEDFFYEVSEIDVYMIFRSLGYKNLLAFELARLCTTTRMPKKIKRFFSAATIEHYHFRNFYETHSPTELKHAHLPYQTRYEAIGVLPQGAPTSPMLSNLAALNLDRALNNYAKKNGFVYTRYADDITLSAAELPRGTTIREIQWNITRFIRLSHFRVNNKKTRIARPGSKKMVLGLLVDGNVPRLSRETFRRIDRLIYAAATYGFESTASHEGFESAFGFYNHVSGLIAFVNDVDSKRWQDFSSRFHSIPVPWMSLI